MSFLVGRAWTREELVFTTATSGSIKEATAFLEEMPTRLRLRIDGSDSWNFDKIRLTHLGSDVSITPKREGACHDLTLVAVSGTLCQSSLEGLYAYLQQWDDKPAYAKPDGSRFIYYLSSFGKWYISSTLGSTSVNARVVSSAADVSGIAATWQEWCSDAWTDSGLSLQGDVSWVDRDGLDCSAYVDYNYCENGRVGSGWSSGWGSFSDFAAGGMDASEACCDCGRRRSTMSGDWLDDSQTSREWKLYGFPYWKSLGSSHKEECTITAGAGIYVCTGDAGGTQVTLSTHG